MKAGCFLIMALVKVKNKNKKAKAHIQTHKTKTNKKYKKNMLHLEDFWDKFTRIFFLLFFFLHSVYP